jgi:site-specific recombinase XerD
MKPTDFARAITDFLGQYLPVECGMSHNTVVTYSITFTLFLDFMCIEELIKPEKIYLKDITKERIIGFLEWLEHERKCSVSTRNARLGAIHSFFRYLQYRSIDGLAKWQEIMSVKYKKTPVPDTAYLTIEGIKLLLRQPDLNTRSGRRDFALLGLLYDSGARVQELIDLTPSSFRFEDTTTIRLCGKGSKVRIVPLSTNQVKNLKQYMAENRLLPTAYREHTLFANRQGNKLSRMAILNIVKKYADMAKAKSPELIPDGIGCHSLRRSKAMHLLEAGINIVYIRDFLGHSSTTTTEVYARASEKKKQEALSKLNPGIIKNGKTSWQKNKELMNYLKDMQRKY